MITVGMSYQVLPGKEQTFENAFAGVVKAMGEDAGHVRTDLYRNVSDPRSYLILSEWKSREAFNGFIRSETFAKVTRWGKEQILAGPPRHEVYEK